MIDKSREINSEFDSIIEDVAITTYLPIAI